MKQKFYFLISIFWMYLFSFGQTLDQSNAPSDVGGGGFTISSTGNVGQSFTAGLTGNLSQVNVRLGGFGSSTAGDFQIRIFDGEGYGGTLLNTTVFTVSTFPVSDYVEIVVPLSSAPSVVSGNKYTIDLRGVTGVSQTQGTGGAVGPYTAGLFFANQNPFAAYSLWFKTFVNVPTPATHLNFDGSNDFVNIGNPIASSSSYTKEAMIFTNNITGSNILSSSTSAFWFWQGNLQAGHGGGFIDVFANASSLINSWNHVALTYDSATTTMKLYINGVLVSQNNSVGQYSAANIQIGAFNSGSVFNGNMDEVRIWNVARTTEQIRGSMNCELQGTETGLIAYYKFNQGVNQANNSAVTTLNAIVGSNGTLTNFALTGTTSNWLAGSPVTTGSIVPSVAAVTTPVVYNQGDTASALTATTGANGTGLLWYTTATAGVGSATAPTPSTASVGSTSYWVSSTNANGCESPRTEIVVTVSLPATHLDFDGFNDLVDCGTTLNTVLDPLNTITVEAWVRPSTNTSLGVIVGNYANPNQSSMQFLLRRENNNYGFWIQGDGTFRNVTATNAVVLNTWQHVAGVWNGSDLKIYINGVLSGTLTGVNDSSFASTTNSMFIGNNQFSGNPEEFTGSIDEVRIWSTARTIEQLNGSKNCELQGAESGLLAYYNFNQGIDQSNNSAVTTLNAITGPNGTLNNFTLNGATSNWLAGSPVSTGSIVPSVASVTTPVVYNQGDTASALTATAGTNGTGLMWYTTATGGIGSTTAPTPNTATAGNTSYWVSSTNANGCESVRSEIVVTVIANATHLNFDGVNDFVVSTNAITNNTENQTYQAWFRIPSIPANSDRILQRGNDGTGGWSLQMDVNAAGRLNAGISATPDTFITGTTVLTPNTWYHATFVFENNNSLRLYLNGNLEASIAIGNRTLRNSDNRLRIGTGNLASEYFNGDIDEVRVWNKV
ncbi:MAG: LamG-like jellyroll fold domain-containing protein, partial [Bacteroidia bacterium]